MKRKEEIEKASDKYIEDYLKSSNEYPLCDNRKRMSLIQVDLYKMQEAFENGMKEADKTMLDRAYEWLKNNIDLYSETAFNIKSGYTEITLTDKFETAFRQAMEGGAE